ncbi:MAG: hypothetical protein MSG64_17670 [Pyrinomonadaceae bacterium MAG19_C2-C3]|nr:hypothetical protein [Pyrinomonadaceae bacterium MAG19_C2-C3]
MSENRDDERRQRQMDFIIEQQAQFTVDIQLIKETIAIQAAASAAEFERVKERMTRAEAFAEQTAQLLYGSLEGQESLQREVRNLMTVTDRIGDAVAFLIDRDAARGNGANGTGDGV